MGRLLNLILTVSGCVVGICWGQTQSPGPVDLCTVAANIQTYSGHEVRITAFFGVGRENVVLYDPKCQDGKPMVWVEFKPKVAGQIENAPPNPGEEALSIGDSRGNDAWRRGR